MTDFKMTVIVPVFNESDNINRIASTFTDYFSKSPTKSKVLFIDDGSTDDSFSKIENVCRNNSNFEFLKFKYNCGLSTAIKAGIDTIKTPLIGYIDADLQTSPFDFDKLLKHIDNYSAVVGYRGNRKDSLNKKIQSKFANSIRRALINDGIIDTGCPLKVIHANVAKKYHFLKACTVLFRPLLNFKAAQLNK